MCVDEVIEELLKQKTINVLINDEDYQLRLIVPELEYWNKAMNLEIYYKNEYIGTMKFGPFGVSTFPDFKLGGAVKAGAYFFKPENKLGYEIKGPCCIKSEFAESISNAFFEIGLRISKRIIDEQPSDKLEKTYWANISYDEKQLDFYKQFGEVQTKGALLYLQMCNLNHNSNIKLKNPL